MAPVPQVVHKARSVRLYRYRVFRVLDLQDKIAGGEWFDVCEHLSETDAITRLWIGEIDRVMGRSSIDFRFETFLRAGIRIYAGAMGRRVSVKEIYETAGYSKSTFHRIFDSFPRYQLKLYQFLCQSAVEVYRERLNLAARTPEEFCRFTKNVVYSSHLSVPSNLLRKIYQLNAPISPSDFHPHLDIMAEVMHDYIRAHLSLGYRRLTFSSFRELIRTLDYDILASKLDQPSTFPSAEQADRLERLLLAYVK